MEADVLQRLSDDGHLTAAEIADILNVTKASAYRYISGDLNLSIGKFRTLVRNCQSNYARLALLAIFAGGAPGVVITLTETELDINGDGEVDTRDVLAIASKVVRDGANLVDAASAEVTEKGDLSAEQAQKVADMVPTHIQFMVAAERIARLTLDKVGRRRKARPFSTLQINGGTQ